MTTHLLVVDDQLPELAEIVVSLRNAAMDIDRACLFFVRDPDEADATQIRSVRDALRRGGNTRIKCGRAGSLSPESDAEGDQGSDYSLNIDHLVGDISAMVTSSPTSDRWVIVVDLRIDSFSATALAKLRWDGQFVGLDIVRRLKVDLQERVDVGSVRLALASRSPHLDRNLGTIDRRQVDVIPKSPESIFVENVRRLLKPRALIPFDDVATRPSMVPISILGLVDTSVTGRVALIVVWVLLALLAGTQLWPLVNR